MVVLAAITLKRLSAGFRPTLESRNKRRPRNNGYANFLPDDGFMVCRLCADQIDLTKIDDGIVCCPNGHSFDLEDEERRYLESDGQEFTKSGLTRTQVGKLAEKIVYDLQHLGEYGSIPRLDDGETKPYKGSLDFVTDHGAGVEVKGVDMTAPTKAFNLAKRQYRLAKDAALAEQGCSVALMLLVVIDFRTMTATIYGRSDQRFKYWELGFKDVPLAVVSFELPDDYAAILGKAKEAREAVWERLKSRISEPYVGVGTSHYDDDIPF